MKKNIETYICDFCKKILSNNDTKKTPHLSITFKRYSGWTKYTKERNMWKHNLSYKQVEGIKHFCNEKCLQKYFKKLKHAK